MPAERVPSRGALQSLLTQLDEIEQGPGGGTLRLPGGERLPVSNLGKPFWPTLKLTKGDLFRHYVRVAPFILPVLADRPLVMKRYPNDVVRGRLAVRTDRRDDGGGGASEAGDDRAIVEGARPPHLRGFHAELAWQDARLRLQRPRQRVRRRLGAAHVGRSGRRSVAE